MTTLTRPNGNRKRPKFETAPSRPSDRSASAARHGLARLPKPTVVGVAALGYAIAAGVHLAIAGGHFAEDWAEGSFFLAAGVLQFGWALATITAPRRAALHVLGLTGSFTILMFWVVSRSVGLPFGPLPGVPDVAALADITAALAATLSIVCAAVLLRVPQQRRALPGTRPAALLALTALVTGGLVVSGTLSHDHSPGAAHGLPDPRIDHRPDFSDPNRAADAPLDAVGIPVGSHPEGVAVGFGSLWVADRIDNTVTRIDPQTQKPVLAPIRVGSSPARIAFSDDTVWVTNYSDGTVSRIDPRTNTVKGAPIPVGSLPVGIAVGSGSVWVANSASSSVSRIDPVTATVVGDPIETGFGPIDVVVDADVVWVVNSLDRAVVRIAAVSGELIGDPIPVGAGSVGIAAGFGRIWVAGTTSGTVTVIDADTAMPIAELVADRFPLIGQGPGSVVTAYGAVWVANSHDKTLVRIDPQTLAVGEPRYYGNFHVQKAGPTQVAAGADTLWVSNFEAREVMRFDPA